MTKKEVLWRHLIHEAITNKKLKFLQKDLAQEFGFSLSTIHNALKAPREIGAIKVTGRNFLIEDKEKFLYLWATVKRLNKEIIYSTYAEEGIREIENKMPSGIIYGAYSAFVKKFEEAPADYDKVYIYTPIETIAEIKARFPLKKGYKNLFILGSDPYLEKMSPKGIVPIEQMFVDIWNLTDWYAKEYLKILKKKML